MTNSTIVRAHQHAAGARRQKGGLMLRASGGCEKWTRFLGPEVKLENGRSV